MTTLVSLITPVDLRKTLSQVYLKYDGRVEQSLFGTC